MPGPCAILYSIRALLMPVLMWPILRLVNIIEIRLEISYLITMPGFHNREAPNIGRQYYLGW